MGIIGPNNQLPRRRAGRGRKGQQSVLFDKEDDLWTENAHMTKTTTDEQKQLLIPVNDAAKISEALSLFPQPKSLLTRVIQVATSSNRIRVSEEAQMIRMHNWSKLLFCIILYI